MTVPGRLCCALPDLPLYRNRGGAAGLKDFPGMIIAAFEAWLDISRRVTIWKDPVTENAAHQESRLAVQKLPRVKGESRGGIGHS